MQPRQLLPLPAWLSLLPLPCSCYPPSTGLFSAVWESPKAGASSRRRRSAHVATPNVMLAHASAAGCMWCVFEVTPLSLGLGFSTFAKFILEDLTMLVSGRLPDTSMVRSV